MLALLSCVSGSPCFPCGVTSAGPRDSAAEQEQHLFASKCQDRDAPPDPTPAIARGESKRLADDSQNKQHLIERRRAHFSRKLSVSYGDVCPLWITRGEGQYLFDENGQRYLDTRNNVAHVGHTHPKVAAAVCAQVSQLNTNTRYLHENILRLAERLLAYSNAGLLMPGGEALEDTKHAGAAAPSSYSTGTATSKSFLFDKVFFVNSGSEANDLAIRLAQTFTNRTEFVAVENGYHGHTAAVVDVSPYKFTEQKPHVHVLTQPSCDETAAKGLRELKGIVNGEHKIAALFIESGMSVGGVVLPPANFLNACAEMVQENGGLLVMDEVQVGLGRYGSSFWAWQSSMLGRCPDIITCGKPMGNGMPLACVITRSEVADCMQKEYFNTFGGNPVCCAAGLAVLDVLESEKLMESAKIVGDYLKQQVAARLIQRRPTVTAAGTGRGTKEEVEVGPGSTSSTTPDPATAAAKGIAHGSMFRLSAVRGQGLFVGLEFEKSEGRGPATEETSALVLKLVQKCRILTSIDGPSDNVIVIKPPMCFSKANVDYLLDSIEACMDEMRKEAPVVVDATSGKATDCEKNFANNKRTTPT
eukprot:g5181.t1